MKEFDCGNGDVTAAEFQEANRQPWYWNGYGLPWDGSQDAKFLSHVCGERGDRDIPESLFSPDGTSVDQMSATQLLQMRRAPGPKRKQPGAASAMVVPSAVLALQAKLKGDEEKRTSLSEDSRIRWIRDLRDAAMRIGDPIRKMGLPFMEACDMTHKAWCRCHGSAGLYFKKT